MDFRVPRAHLSFIRALDSQREKGKGIFGSGFLISEKAVAEKAAAEKAAAENAAAGWLDLQAPAEQASAEQAGVVKWQLSERELAIVSTLGK